MSDEIQNKNDEILHDADASVKVVDDIEQEDHSEEEVITTPFSPSDIKISNPPMNMGDLIDMLSYGWINLQTKYQREMNLWSPAQQSRLIESALLGLRLPAFYFEVVDTGISSMVYSAAVPSRTFVLTAACRWKVLNFWRTSKARPMKICVSTPNATSGCFPSRSISWRKAFQTK